MGRQRCCLCGLLLLAACCLLTQADSSDFVPVARAPVEAPAAYVDDRARTEDSCRSPVTPANFFLKPTCEETVGSGPAGFGGLSVSAKIKRWMQAHRAPDVKLIDLVNDALPAYVGFIIAEAIVAHLQGKKIYYLRQTASNLAGMAIMYGILGIFMHGLSIFPYIALHKMFGVYSKNNILSHLIAFFGVDFFYYWSHRFGHATNLGWGTHGSHHSSPDFNYSTGIRSSTHEVLVSWFFYLPLALVVHPDVYFIHHGITYLAQFTLHTQVIDSLGPLEWFLNTPSHHRVHHSRNYPSCNFGGALIIFDRVFGTFCRERKERPCAYGLDERKMPMDTHNICWHNIQHLYFTFKAMAKSNNPLRILMSRAHGEGMIQPDLSGHRDGAPKLPADGVPCDTRFGWYDVHFWIQVFVAAIPVSLSATVGSDKLELWQTLLLAFNSVQCITILLTNLHMRSTALRNEVIRILVLSASVAALLGPRYYIYVTGYCVVSLVSGIVALQRDAEFPTPEKVHLH